MSEAPAELLLPERGPGGRFLPRPPPAPTPRQELAAAIDRHHALSAERDRTVAALDRAAGRRLDAAAARRAAEAALAAAQEDASERLADAWLAGEDPGRSPVKAAAADAAEQQAALDGAEPALRTRLGEIDRALGWAAERRRERAAAVLATAPAITVLVDRAETLMRELVEVGDHAMWLVNAGVLQPIGGYGFDPSAAGLPTRVRLLVDRLNHAPVGWKDLLRAAPETWRRWADALEALEADADAALPE